MEKTEKIPKNEKTATTGDIIKPIADEITIEDTEVKLDEPKAEKSQEKSEKAKKKEKEDLLFGDMINETVKLLINQTYLRNSDDKITSKEIKDTQFGESLSKTINYYFPNKNFNHPLFGLVASGGMLLVLLNQKVPMINNANTDGEIEESEGESEELSEGDGSDQGVSTSNPYANLPKK